jgi:hypothetical protein
MNTVFITGVQRSGTTLLSMMLGRHPAIYMEERVISFRLISAIKNAAELWPYNLQVDKTDFYRWLVRTDGKGRLAEFLDLDNWPAGASLQDLIRNSVAQHLTRHQKNVWGDKGPNLQYFIPELLQLFPDARFIHIIRDGRATAHSMSRRAYQSLRLSAQQWVDGNVQAMVQQDVLGQEKLLLIRFEDLLSDPEAVLRKVCDFLEIGFSELMLELQQDIPEEEQYVKSRLQADKISAYREKLSPARLRALERIQGPLLQRLGYELLSEPPPRSFQPLSIFQQVFLNQAGNLRRLFLFRQEGMSARKKVEIKMSFPRRAHHFLMYLAKDLLSKPLFRRIFQAVFYKEKYYRKDG